MTLALALALAVGFDHSAWDRVLKSAVNDIGEVDYAAIRKNRAGLDAYTAALRQASPANRKDLFPSRAHELAYWLNAYNAFVTRGVVDGWPVKSVRDLGFLWGFFREKEHVAGGAAMSLDNIEHDTIRKQYREPRIHFALVCASVSCPRLARQAFRGEVLEEQLDRLTRQFFEERRNLSIDTAARTVTLSKLLDWYGEDFRPGVLAWIRPHLSEENRRKLDSLRNPSIRHYDYDWSINDPGSRARAASPLERELARTAGQGRP